MADLPSEKRVSMPKPSNKTGAGRGRRGVTILAAAIAVVAGATATILMWPQPPRAPAVATSPWAPASAPAQTAPPARTVPRLPSLDNRRSVVVLPFANLGDPGQAYFVDGIAEDILTALTHFDALLPIAWNSGLAHRGDADRSGIVRELGARYVLEGGVNKAGDRLQMTARLIDAAPGNAVWEERYDAPLGDIFAIQDDIVRRIAAATAANARGTEFDRARQKRAEKVEAYDLTLQARALFADIDKEAMTEARLLLARAVQADPFYAPAYVWLARVHREFANNPWNKEYGGIDGFLQGEILLARAIDMQPNNALAHAARAATLSVLGRHQEALAEGERALALGANDAEVLTLVGNQFRLYGRHDGAIELQVRAMRLDPHYPPSAAALLGRLYVVTSDLVKASDAFAECRSRDPEERHCLFDLASVQAQLGRMDEARVALADLLRLEPAASIGEYRNLPNRWRDPEDESRMVEGLRKAGLPE